MSVTYQLDLHDETAKEEHKSPDSVWKDYLNWQELQRTSNYPDRTSEVFEGTPQAEPGIWERGGPYADEAGSWSADVKQDAAVYTNSFESIYNGLRGTLDPLWMVEQDPEDLTLLNTGDPELDIQANALLQHHSDTIDWAKTWNEEVDAAFNERVDARMRSYKMVDLLVGLHTGGLARYNPDREKAYQAELEIAANTYEKGLGDRVLDVISWSFGKIARGITYAEDRLVSSDAIQLSLAVAGGFTVNNVDLSNIRDYDTSTERAEARRLQDKQYTSAQFDTYNELVQAGVETQREVIAQTVQSGEIENMMPETWDILLEAANNDQIVAMGLLIGAIEDAQTTEEQLDLGRMVRDETIKMIEESDYQVNAKVLDLLASWDRLLPARIATGLTLLWTDDDFQYAFANKDYQSMLARIDDFDRTPSKVLGWEGTLLGFTTDMGSSMFFDPSTWIFSPAGKAAFGKPMSRAAARDMATSGVGKHAVRDLVKNWGDDAAVAEAALWIQEGSLEVFDELMGLVTKVGDDLGDVLGPGLDEATSNTLRQLAEEGVKETPGASPNVALIREKLGSLLDSTEAQVMKVGETPIRFTLPNSKYDYVAIGVKDVDGTSGVIIMNADTRAIGGGIYWSPNGAGWYAATDKLKISEKVVDALVTADGWGSASAADMLISSSKDLSITKAGAGAMNKQINRFVDELAGGKGAAVLDAIPEQQLTDLVEKAILNGAVPTSHRRLALAASVGTALKESVRLKKPGSFLNRYAGKHRIRTVFSTSGRRAYSEAVETAYFLWGDDAAKASEWTQRILEGRRQAADQGQALLNDTRVGQVVELEKQSEILAKALEDELLSPAQRMEMQDALNTITKEYDEMAAALYDEFGSALDTGLHDVLLDMMDDYNRNVIAKMPEWADKVDGGMVPWEELKLGGVRPQGDLPAPGFTGLLPDSPVDDMVDVVKAQNAFNAVYQRGAKLTVTLPISPYDAILAGSTGGANYLKLLKSKWYGGTANLASELHRGWKLDKILRLSTAAVVSADELFRVFHLYGVEAMGKYMADKLLSVYDTARNVMNRKGSGFEKLPPHMQARIRELSNIPGYITEAEGLLWDQLGQTLKVINPGDPGYVSAAREFYRNFTAQPGFRAYLQGEDAFRAWWQTDAAATARRQVGATSSGPRVLTVDTAYQGWDTIYKVLTRGIPQQKLKFVRDEMLKAADEIAAGGRGYMPKAVFDYTDAVKGQQRAAFGNKFQTVLGTTSEFLLDKFFMEPTNYRRGFLYNMAKNKEVNRLRLLFADQNRKILTDTELVRAMGLPDGTSLASFPKDVLDVWATRRGLITERMIDDMAESAAIQELDNVFYAWDKGSKFGHSTRAFFPFGGPWADMWGFWGREILSKPVLRGDVNNNAFLRTLQSGINDVPLPNVKAGAFISRMANKDFNLENGLYPDSEGPGVDLSPLIFFPTQGENSFQTLLPGLGFFPSTLIDWVLETLVDPIEDPVAYQQMLDEVAAVIPSVQYTTGDWTSDLFGGGNVSAAWKTSVGLTQAATAAAGRPSPWHSFANLGDYSADIELNRELGVLLAEDFEDLLRVDNPQLLATAVQGMLMEARGNVGARTAASGFSRFMLPARFDWDESAEQLQDIWVETATLFPQLAPRQVSKEQLGDTEVLRQYVNDVRENYFNLEQEEADLILIQNPALAVNLVSNWQWSKTAREDLTMEREVLFPYRSGGSNEDAARHQTYVERGLIEPIAPMDRAYIAMGMVLKAKERVASSIYAETAGAVNDLLWEGYVSDRDKAILQAHMTEFGDKYQVTDIKTLWENWGSWEDDFEEELSFLLGIPQDSEEFKDIARRYNVKQRAWSTTRPQIGEGLSQRWKRLQLADIPIEMLPTRQMEALGVDFDIAMNGEQLWQGTVDAVWQNPNYNVEVEAKYMSWISSKSDRRQVAVDNLRQMFQRSEYDDEFRQQVSEFLIVEQNIMDKIDKQGYVKRSDQRQVRNRFQNLIYTSGDEAAMLRLWDDAFESRFGPLDWTPPTPPDLYEEDGELNRYAYRPIVRQVVDGDTLVVALSTPILGSVSTQNKKIRLLGVRARDFGIDDAGAIEDKQTLMDALLEAARTDAKIYLVRDPDQFGSNTDKYGRELAWLYIGDEPWYSEDAFLPTDR